MLYPIELLAHMETPTRVELAILGLQPRALPLGYGIVVLVVGFEPTRHCWQQILSLPCLPIPSHQRVSYGAHFGLSIKS